MEMAEVSLRIIRVFPDSVIAAMFRIYSLILILLLSEEQVYMAWSPAIKAVLFPISGKQWTLKALTRCRWFMLQISCGSSPNFQDGGPGSVPGRLGSKAVQVGSLYPLQFWKHPLGTCMISKISMLIRSEPCEDNITKPIRETSAVLIGRESEQQTIHM